MKKVLSFVLSKTEGYFTLVNFGTQNFMNYLNPIFITYNEAGYTVL